MKWHILVLISICLLSIFILLNANYNLSFEEIQVVIPKEELNPIKSTIRPWFSIRNEKYNPWYDLDYIKAMGIDYDTWDLDKGQHRGRFSVFARKIVKPSLEGRFARISPFG